MKNKKDFYTGLLFLILTGAIFTMILRSPTHLVSSGPGPFFFPAIAAFLLGSLSLALLFKGARQGEGRGKGVQGKRIWGRTIWIITWSVIYAATIETLGYLLSTGLVTFALLAYFNRRSWIFNTVLSVVTAVSIFILFDTLLKVSMPRGILGF